LPETREAVVIVGDGRGQDLDRDIPIQGRVAGSIRFAHAPGAQKRDDVIDAEACARLKGSQGVGGSIC
jgi:hypothetical protein